MSAFIFILTDLLVTKFDFSNCNNFEVAIPFCFQIYLQYTFNHLIKLSNGVIKSIHLCISNILQLFSKHL